MLIRFKHTRELGAVENIVKVSLLAVLVITAFGIFDFVLPLFVEGFDVPMTLIGLAVSLVYVLSFFAELPSGVIVDALGRKRTLLLALCVLAGVSGLYFISKSFYSVLIAGAIFGLFAVSFWIPSAVLVREYTPKKMIARSQGIYLTFSQIGWIAGPIVGGLIATYFSLKHNFIAIGILFAIAAIYALFVFKHKAGKLKVKRLWELTEPHKIFWNFTKTDKQAIPVFMLSILLNIWIGVEWVFPQLAGMNAFHFSPQLIGIILGAMMGIEGLLYFTSSYIMDLIGKKWILISGFFLLFASAYFVFLTPIPEVFIFGLLLAAGSVAWIFPGTEAVITEIAPKEKLGEVTAVFDSSKDLGLMIAPILGGVLADLSGNVQAPFLMVSILAAVGVFVALRIKS